MTAAPHDPSQGNSSFAERRTARMAREAAHGVPERHRTALRAGDRAENDFTMSYLTDDGTPA